MPAGPSSGISSTPRRPLPAVAAASRTRSASVTVTSRPGAPGGPHAAATGEVPAGVAPTLAAGRLAGVAPVLVAAGPGGAELVPAARPAPAGCPHAATNAATSATAPAMLDRTGMTAPPR